MTRGLDLNNPGDIRISSSPWHGKLQPSRDPDFETFDTPENGIRALARIILNYYRYYGLNTVTAVINRFAPPSENPTAAYVTAVCEQTGFDPDSPIDLTSSDTLSALTQAVIHQEQGQMPYSTEQINSGVAAALA
jgi:hypothetical protein